MEVPEGGGGVLRGVQVTRAGTWSPFIVPWIGKKALKTGGEETLPIPPCFPQAWGAHSFLSSERFSPIPASCLHWLRTQRPPGQEMEKDQRHCRCAWQQRPPATPALWVLRRPLLAR